MKALVVTALAVALIAARDDPADGPLAERVAGPAVDCIDLDRVGGPAIERDGTILYPQNGRRTWRATLAGACPALRPMATLIVEVHGRRLCANDRFRVREGLSIPSGYCRFAGFTPFDKPAPFKH